MTTNNMGEYNRIHALAGARRRMMTVYDGPSLRLWPMADDYRVVRDLARKKPLFGSKDCAQQASGMLDYALDLGQESSYVADFTADIDDWSTDTTWQGVYEWMKLVLKAGIWDKFDVGVYAYNNCIGYGLTFHLYLAREGLTPTEVEAQYVEHVQWAPTGPSAATLTIDPGHPFVITGDDQWALYLRRVCSSEEHFEGWRYAIGEGGGSFDSYYYYNVSEWAQPPQYKYATKCYGTTDFDTWPSMDEFTMGVWVNADDYSAKDGVLMALSNGSEELAKIAINSNKQPTAYIKDAGSNTYSLSSSRMLHPGFNWLTLSFKRNEANTGVKLGVNGEIVDDATSNDQPLFGQQLAVALGARVLTTKATSSHLKGAIVDDAFVVGKVASDSNLWSVYRSYITAAPLMQLAMTEVD